MQINASEKIRGRLVAAGKAFCANDTIADCIEGGELKKLEDEVANKMQGVLDALVIDTENDHNTRGTARRVAKMFLREVFAGRYEAMPKITDFPNSKNLDELYTLGPIEVRSACSHHFCPIVGDLWCGVIPSKTVIGISKFSRISRWVLARPQIQEEAIMQLADLLESLIKPQGLAVVIRAKHSCMTWRGVKESATSMTTAVVRGRMKNEQICRDEFYRIIAGQGFTCR